MSPIAHPFRSKSPLGQVVRSPMPADGVGVALRRSYVGSVELPDAWLDCLRQLDDLPRH
jgi:hypothetical protein